MKMPLGMEIGLIAEDFVFDGDSASLPKKGAELPSPIFGPLHCGQTAGCMKMPLGMEVGLCPGDFVLYGDSAPLSEKGAEPPSNF